jgi:hypothetical protein
MDNLSGSGCRGYHMSTWRSGDGLCQLILVKTDLRDVPLRTRRGVSRWQPKRSEKW